MRSVPSLLSVAASSAFFLVVILGAVEANRAEAPLAGERPQRPAKRVIFISLDTLRQDHLSVYGYPRPTSPRLEELAKEAAVFDTAMSQAPFTLPSHMSMMTGLAIGAHRVRTMDDKLSACHETIAEVLRAAGYRTAAFTDGGFMSGRFGFDHGFEFYDDARVKGSAEKNGFRRYGTRVKEWIEDHADERFFLFLHTFDTHAPYFAEDEHRQALAGTVPVLPQGALQEEHPMEYLRALAYHDYMELDQYESLAELVDHYDAAIHFVDQQVGALVDHLKRLDLWEDSLVIITSDHGEAFLDHGLYVGHGLTLYEEEVRVPLFVKFPYGRHAGTRVTDVVRLLDLFATIAAACAIEDPPQNQGLDLVAAIEGREQDPRIARGASPNYATGKGLTVEDTSSYLRGADLKYVEAPAIGWTQIATRHLRARVDLPDVPEAGDGAYDFEADPLGLRARIPDQAQVFDVRNDPGERVDLAQARPRDRDGMRRRLEQGFARDGAYRCTDDADADQSNPMDLLTSDEIDRLVQLGYLSFEQGELEKKKIRDRSGEGK